MSISSINTWYSDGYRGGYASPFSELTKEDLKGSGFAELLENGQLKYIRSGTRTRREGILFAGMSYVNQYLRSPFLFRVMNKRFVFTELSYPFLPSVAIHKDTTVEELRHFFRAMRDNQSVVLCLHGVLHQQEGDYEKRFNWDYESFEGLLKFLKNENRINVRTTAQIVDNALNRSTK